MAPNYRYAPVKYRQMFIGYENKMFRIKINIPIICSSEFIKEMNKTETAIRLDFILIITTLYFSSTKLSA